jgi:hypothetical protein
MIKLVANKNFLNRGVMTMEGDEFEVNEGMVYDYLANGLARRASDGLASASEYQQEQIENQAPENAPLTALKVTQLRVMAEQKGIANSGGLNKQELISALQATI